MTFGEICNYFLYALSGFFFGIFASRYSILAAIKIVANVKEQGIFSGVLGSFLQVVFIAVAFFIFPVWFITRTQVGGFFYYAVLVYFFNKGFEGNRNGLIWITKDILDWDNFRTKQELNQFEIAIDLEDLYVSFFLKPENHA